MYVVDGTSGRGGRALIRLTIFSPAQSSVWQSRWQSEKSYWTYQVIQPRPSTSAEQVQPTG